MLAAQLKKALRWSLLMSPIFSWAGVSIKPRLTALTRMPRPFRSEDQVRAKERTAAFVAL
jgi:hypothetical protein